MSKDVYIWRMAIQVIQECGSESNPKAFAYSKCSEMHAKGKSDEAIRWAEIANAIDDVLEGVDSYSTATSVIH